MKLRLQDVVAKKLSHNSKLLGSFEKSLAAARKSYVRIHTHAAIF
jgi:hypothetical protein